MHAPTTRSSPIAWAFLLALLIQCDGGISPETTDIILSCPSPQHCSFISTAQPNIVPGFKIGVSQPVRVQTFITSNGTSVCRQQLILNLTRLTPPSNSSAPESPESPPSGHTTQLQRIIKFIQTYPTTFLAIVAVIYGLTLALAIRSCARHRRRYAKLLSNYGEAVATVPGPGHDIGSDSIESGGPVTIPEEPGPAKSAWGKVVPRAQMVGREPANLFRTLRQQQVAANHADASFFHDRAVRAATLPKFSASEAQRVVRRRADGSDGDGDPVHTPRHDRYSMYYARLCAELSEVVYFDDAWWRSRLPRPRVITCPGSDFSVPLKRYFNAVLPPPNSAAAAAGGGGGGEEKGEGALPLYGEGVMLLPASCDVDDRESGGRGRSWRGLVYDKKTDTHVMLALQPAQEALILIARGTDSAANLLTGSLAVHREFVMPKGSSRSGGKVHYGYYQAWQSVQPRVFAIIKKVIKQHPIKHIYCTGHSLGGALATLGAVSISFKFPALAQGLRVYTFGAPMLGDRLFTQMYNRQVAHSWRHINDKDIIPHIPQVWFDFDHAGIAVLVNEKGCFYDPSPEVLDMDDGHGDWLLEHLSDHSLTSYTRLISVCAARLRLGTSRYRVLKRAWRIYVSAQGAPIQLVFSVGALLDCNGAPAEEGGAVRRAAKAAATSVGRALGAGAGAFTVLAAPLGVNRHTFTNAYTGGSGFRAGFYQAARGDGTGGAMLALADLSSDEMEEEEEEEEEWEEGEGGALAASGGAAVATGEGAARRRPRLMPMRQAVYDTSVRPVRLLVPDEDGLRRLLVSHLGLSPLQCELWKGHLLFHRLPLDFTHFVTAVWRTVFQNHTTQRRTDVENALLMLSFVRFDSNNEGFLSFSEFRVLVSSLFLRVWGDEELLQSLSSIDLDVEYGITFPEFVVWKDVFCPRYDEDKIRECMRPPNDGNADATDAANGNSANRGSGHRRGGRSRQRGGSAEGRSSPPSDGGGSETQPLMPSEKSSSPRRHHRHRSKQHRGHSKKRHPSAHEEEEEE